MKRQLTLIAWSLIASFQLSGQIKFESNSVTELSYERILGKPQFDSVQFVFRFWQCSKHVPGILLELELRKDGHWKSRSGFVNIKKGIFVAKQSRTYPVHLDSIWHKLDSIGILTIRDQINAEWFQNTQSGQTIKIKFQPDIYDRNGVLFILEFLSRENERRLSYIDASGLQKMMQSRQITSEDHEKIILVTDILRTEFNLDPLWKEYFFYSKPPDTLQSKKKSKTKRL